MHEAGVSFKRWLLMCWLRGCCTRGTFDISCLLVQERDAARSDRQQVAAEAAIATRQLQTLQQEQLALQEAHAALQRSNALLQQGRLSQMEAARIASGTQGMQGNTAASKQADRGMLGTGVGRSPAGAPATGSEAPRASSLSGGGSRSPGTADAAPVASSGALRPSSFAPSGSRSQAAADAAPAAGSGALQPSSLSQPGSPSIGTAAPHQAAAASAVAKPRLPGQGDSRPASSAAEAASRSPFDELRSALFDQQHDLRPGSTAVDASQRSSLRAGRGPSTAERLSPTREEIGAASFAASRVMDEGLAVHDHLAAEPLELAEELEDAFQDPDADRLQQEASFSTLQQQGGTDNHGSMTLSQIASPDYLDGI